MKQTSLRRPWDRLPAIAATVLLIAASSANAERKHARETAELRTYTQQLLDAIAPGDKTIWQKLLSANFIGMDEEGHVRTKIELLSEIRPLPAGLEGKLMLDKFQVAFEGDVAVVAHEDQEQLDYHGQLLNSRFRTVDNWLHTRAGWRLIGQHTAAVLKDPPALHVQWADRCQYSGRYRLSADIELLIRCNPLGLVASRAGRPDVAYSMEAPDVFFVKGQPRTRRIFQHGDDGSITGFVDRREGEDVHWIKTGDL